MHVASMLISITLALECVVGNNPLPRDTDSVAKYSDMCCYLLYKLLVGEQEVKFCNKYDSMRSLFAA